MMQLTKIAAEVLLVEATQEEIMDTSHQGTFYVRQNGTRIAYISDNFKLFNEQISFEGGYIVIGCQSISPGDMRVLKALIEGKPIAKVKALVNKADKKQVDYRQIDEETERWFVLSDGEARSKEEWELKKVPPEVPLDARLLSTKVRFLGNPEYDMTFGKVLGWIDHLEKIYKFLYP